MIEMGTTAPGLAWPLAVGFAIFLLVLFAHLLH